MNQRRNDSRSPKRHTSDAGCFASDGEMNQIANIDLRGGDGRDGRDGQNFRNPPSSYGANGRRGGDATPARCGLDAAVVSIAIDYAGSSTDQVLINGVIRSQQNQHQDFRLSPHIGDDGYIFIEGIGGKGGNGGRGGDGQPGANGRRGRNATRYSSGGNGGPGGHGGNAGNPTDGAPGGNGADVQIAISDRHLGLLMLTKGNLAGGDIGFAGEAGRGGSGGRGGPGGSSYHWTESRSYTDSQGKRRTRIVHRSNPGGFRGRNGSGGAPSMYRAKDGVPGRVGKLTVTVIDQYGRKKRYPSPYNLELVTFDIVGEESVLEPDSLVSLDRLTIRNCGGMPTPPNYRVRIFLDSDQWILQDDQHLTIEKSIQPGHTYTFTDQGLKFRLGDHVVDAPRRFPFRLRHPADPHAIMESGISRRFRQFENSETLNVRFPVEIKALTCLNSLAPGESTRVIWAVTNVGEETFDHKYLRRAVKNSVTYLGGDVDVDCVQFFDDEDEPYDLVSGPMVRPIRDMKPGESRVIETRVGVKETSQLVPYQGFALAVQLDLQRPGSSDHSDEFRCVDYRKAFIRIAEKYKRESGSRFLLVANHRTSVNDIQRWSQMADYFGSTLDVWDVSYYGFFDLVRDVEKDESLLEQWRGMTIIVPNNYYETPEGKTVAFRQLAKTQFLRAAADHDINFYVVGDSRTGGEDMLAAALVPVVDDRPSRLKSQKEFLDKVDRWNKYIARASDVVGNQSKAAAQFADTELGAVHEFEIDKRTILFQPDKEWLQREAIRLQRKLQKDDPLHRWIVVHRYDTGDTDTSWGFFKNRKVGKLEVRRTLDATKGSAVLYEVDAIDLASEDFITSEQNKRGMFLALKFEDKVDRFIRLVSTRTFPRYSENFIDRPLTEEEIKDIGNELVDSILIDIYNEQKVARESKVWTLAGARPLMPKLNYLAERSLNYGVTLTQMDENPASMQLLFDLIASIGWMAKESMSVWDLAIFPTAFFKRSRAVSKHMLNRANRIVINIFGTEPSWWSKMTDPGDDFDAMGNARKRRVDGGERAAADLAIAKREEELRRKFPKMEGYTTAQDLPGLTYDPELIGKQMRVIEGEQFDRMVRQEQQADVARAATEQAVRSERNELLVPLENTTTIPTRTRTVSVQNTN